jgi:hypothetical protein
MKKVFLLAFFAMAALFSQAWAAYQVCSGSYAGYCYWAESPDAKKCNAISIDPDASWSQPSCEAAFSNCNTNGEFYNEASCDGKEPIDNNKTMCLWNAAGSCWPVPSSDGKTVEDCVRDGWLYNGGTEGANSYCSGGAFSGQGKNQTPPAPGGNTVSLGCCKWDSGTQCWDIFTETEKTDCSGGSNQFWSGACPDQQGTCPSGGTPALKFTPVSTGLVVVPFGSSLHISSPKEASVLLFDMQGKQVFSKKLSANYNIVAFENQKQGVYYAVVTSGSSKQTVKVLLK